MSETEKQRRRWRTEERSPPSSQEQSDIIDKGSNKGHHDEDDPPNQSRKPPSSSTNQEKKKRRHRRRDDSSSSTCSDSSESSYFRRRNKRKKKEKKKRRRKRSSRKRHKRRKKHHSDSDESSSSDDSLPEKSADTDKKRKRHGKLIKVNQETASDGGNETGKSKVQSPIDTKKGVQVTVTGSEKATTEDVTQVRQAVADSRRMVPMTREQYEAEQSKVRDVYDPETGRMRLVRGSGEIIERIVSREAHQQINQQATRGDGASFSRMIHGASRRF